MLKHTFSSWLLYGGIIVVGLGLLMQPLAMAPSAADSQIPVVDTSTGNILKPAQPVKISVPGLVESTITNETYVNNQWSISETTASYLSTSAKPREKGNIIVYGHNKNSVLGKMRDVTGTEIITLTLIDGTLRHYEIINFQQVPASDVSALQPSNNETLTIYTCAGLFDQYRFVVRAEPIEEVVVAKTIQ